MKHIFNTLFLFYLSFSHVNCHQNNDSGATTYQSSLTGDDDQCPFWHFFNATTNMCECYTSANTRNDILIVKCTEKGIELRVGFCMTYDELEKTVYIVPCVERLSGNFSTTGNGRYIELPVQNASELNDYMCGPMNRKGRLCSECIQGFGLSVTSPGFVCSNCTGAWYGIPLYLFLEFVPITVFYVIILLFRVNITSAPMVAYVFFSQFIVAVFVSYGVQLQFQEPASYYWVLVVVTFYGFWNLDFFRYIIPPFCISSKLKHIHITLLAYLSSFYPLCLICITWIIVKLHFYNFKPVIWLWSKLSKFSCVRDRSGTSSSQRNSLVDVFTTFFLLSYTKLVYTSSTILSPQNAMAFRNNTLSNTIVLSAADTGIEYFSKEHALYALISILIIVLIIAPPVLLLILYPIKMFRLIFFKCHLSTRTLTSLNIFVEKYYSCYRDGTEGGKDMRSLASMYFILIWMFVLIFRIISASIAFILLVVLYTSYQIVIALIRPYKKAYMNIIDPLILANLALLALMGEKYYLEDSLTLLYAITISVFTFLPLLSLIGFIAYRKLRWFWSKLNCFKLKKDTFKHQISNSIAQEDQQDNINDSDQELPDRVLHPQQYVVRMDSFANVNYVRAS